MLDLEKLSLRKAEILALAASHGVLTVRVFGSVARGDTDSLSDVDFLVELGSDRSLLDLGGFQMDLQDLLGIPVDVVTTKGLKQRIRSRVLSEAKDL
jgi:hypothetical protein